MKRVRFGEHPEKLPFRKQTSDFNSLIPARDVLRSLSPSADLLQPRFCSAFFNQVELVRFYIMEYLARSARPNHFNSRRNQRISKTKIGPQIALRKIAPAAGNLPNL